MKKLLLIIFLFTGIVNAQIVNIPDADFKAELLNASVSNYIASNTYPTTATSFFKIDANNDGEIQVSEALNVFFLNLANSSISDLTGIEQFSNLRFLNCSMNDLTNISNVNALTNLIHLDCGNNVLTGLNVSPLINLKVLTCYNNQLTTLDVSALSNLEELWCYSNQLTNIIVNPVNSITWLQCSQNNFTSLDLSFLTHLTFLNCSYNQLTSLNVSMLTNLTELNCHENQLTVLDVSALTSLNELTCIGNELTVLDVSALANLTELLCYNNNLTFLNLKNGSNETNLQFSSNPNLQFICADESQLLAVQSKINAYGYTNCNLNTYCSFTPGGNYNTITGSMIFDGNNNGCDISDLPRPNIKININDGTNQGVTFTNNTGNYNFFTQIGSFVVTPAIENPTWFNFSPTTATIPFANNNNNTITQNFCISANGVHPDLEIVVSPIVPARPGFDAVYQIVYRNKGNQTLSQLYGINFFYNENLMDFVSASTATSSANSGSLSWDFANLQPFESRSIIVTLNINEPTDATYPVNIDDELQFTTSILPMAGDETTSDNTFVLHQTVVGAYDPNDITCLEGDSVAPSQIGNYLHYIINFENTGNYQAENIVVQDVIDATKFDISSLQIMNSSDPVYAKLTGNVAEFIFENIDLDSGGHGNILLKVRTKSSLQNGDFVNKNANIYFDYNAPITTNIANTIFQALGVTDNNLDNSIVIYPNPAVSVINVKCNFDIKSIQLYDIQGRILQTKLTNEMNAVIDISDKSNGVYFLKVVSDKGIKVEKIIKE